MNKNVNYILKSICNISNDIVISYFITVLYIYSIRYAATYYLFITLCLMKKMYFRFSLVSDNNEL